MAGGLAFLALLGLVLWGAAVALSRGDDVDVQVGDDVFRAGEAEALAEEIADGPLLFPGLVGTAGTRAIGVHHAGGDPRRGWTVFSIVQGRAACWRWTGRRSSCSIPAPASGYPSNGAGLAARAVVGRRRRRPDHRPHARGRTRPRDHDRARDSRPPRRSPTVARVQSSHGSLQPVQRSRDRQFGREPSSPSGGLADLGQGEPHLEARPPNRRVQHLDRAAVADGDGLAPATTRGPHRPWRASGLRRGGRSARTPARGRAAGCRDRRRRPGARRRRPSSPSVTVTTDVAWRAALSSRLRTSRCELDRVALDPGRRHPVGPHGVAEGPEPGHVGQHHLVEVDDRRVPRRAVAARLVELGQRQQVGHQLVEALALVQHRRRHVGPVGAAGGGAGPPRRSSGSSPAGSAARGRRPTRTGAASSGPPRAGRACRSWCGRGGPPRRPWRARRRAGAAWCALISSTSWRMRSTGCRARPTSHHVTRPTRTTRSGMPSQRFEASAWTLRAHLVEGRRGDDPVVAARRVHDPLHDLVAVRQEARHRHQLTLRVEGEELRGGRARRRLDDVAAGVDHLHPGSTDRRHADHADLLAALEGAHGGVERPGRRPRAPGRSAGARRATPGPTRRRPA